MDAYAIPIVTWNGSESARRELSHHSEAHTPDRFIGRCRGRLLRATLRTPERSSTGSDARVGALVRGGLRFARNALAHELVLDGRRVRQQPLVRLHSPPQWAKRECSRAQCVRATTCADAGEAHLITTLSWHGEGDAHLKRWQGGEESGGGGTGGGGGIHNDTQLAPGAVELLGACGGVCRNARRREEVGGEGLFVCEKDDAGVRQGLVQPAHLHRHSASRAALSSAATSAIARGQDHSIERDRMRRQQALIVSSDHCGLHCTCRDLTTKVEERHMRL